MAPGRGLRLAAHVILLLMMHIRATGAQKASESPTGQHASSPTSLDALLPKAAMEGEANDDTYLCTSVPLPSDTLQLTAFQARAKSDAVTSMMLYGEEAPLSGVLVVHEIQQVVILMRIACAPCGDGLSRAGVHWSNLRCAPLSRCTTRMSGPACSQFRFCGALQECTTVVRYLCAAAAAHWHCCKACDTE